LQQQLSQRITKLQTGKCYSAKIKTIEINRSRLKESRQNFNNGFTTLSIKVQDITSAEEWSTELKKAQSTIETLSTGAIKLENEV